MNLTFVGGAKEVTGACYLLEDKNMRLLVDCGLHQDSGSLEKQNVAQFPFNPKEITALLVTHAHIDHTGRIPQLVKAGFSGDIFSTAPTKESFHELILDAHHLMERERREKNMAMSYGPEDIEKALSLWKTISYRQKFSVGHFEIEFYNSGHILGSSSILVSSSGKTIAFSGDLGNIPAPLVKDTEYIERADYALIESAYGGRTHESVEERRSMLEDLIEDTVREGGVLMIPAFAMERTQQLLYEINNLVEQGRIPKVPVFIDSPLAIRLTAIYERFSVDSDFFDDEVIAMAKKGDEIFNFPGLRFTLTTEQSKEINDAPPPKIIIAGSGISSGGRILHHEVRYLPDSKSTILFVGFQTQGSLGRRILDGAREVVIMNQRVPVRACVEAIGGYSAHADQPLLLRWIGSMKESVKKVFVVQGEEDQSTLLVDAIRDKFAIDARIPQNGETVAL